MSTATTLACYQKLADYLEFNLTQTKDPLWAACARERIRRAIPALRQVPDEEIAARMQRTDFLKVVAREQQAASWEEFRRNPSHTGVDAESPADEFISRSPLRAVLHQLEHGEASDGDLDDIQWCARELRHALQQPMPAGMRSALKRCRDFLVHPAIRDWLDRSGVMMTEYGHAVVGANAYLEGGAEGDETLEQMRSYRDYVEAKIEIGEMPLTFVQWCAVEALATIEESDQAAQRPPAFPLTDAAYHELNFTSAADLQGTLDALVQQADLHTLVDAQGRAWGVELTPRFTRDYDSDSDASASCDPSPAELAQEIERLAEQAGVSEELFSDAVHDVFSQQGSAVNNEGFYEQALTLLRERAFGDLQKTSAVLRTMIAQDTAGEPAAHCSDCGALLARPSAEHYQVTCPDCGAENSA